MCVDQVEDLRAEARRIAKGSRGEELAVEQL